MSDAIDRILMIEDNPGDARLLQESLRDVYAGNSTVFSLKHAKRLEEGLEILRNEPIDTVLLDLSLPDSQGLKTVERVVAEAPDLPVLVMTGNDDERLALDTLQYGAEDYLVKGEFDSMLLLRALRYARQRKASKLALRESERFARATVDALSAHIAILDETGQILSVNQAWEAFPENEHGKLPRVGVGVNYIEVCSRSAASGDAFAMAARDILQTMVAGNPTRTELEYPCHNHDQQQWFLMRCSYFQGSGPIRIVVAHEDITARKLAEEQLRHQVERLESLRTIDSYILASTDLRLTLDVCLRELTQLLRVDAADVLAKEPHSHLMRYQAGYGFRSDDAANEHLFIKYNPLDNDTTRARPPRVETILKREGFHSYRDIELKARGQTIGILELFNREPFQDNPDWRSLLSTLSSQIAIAIDSARLMNDLRRSHTELQHSFDDLLIIMSRMIEMHAGKQSGRTRRVAQLSAQMARYTGMSENEVRNVYHGALLHDIGLIGVPTELLLPDARLTPAEQTLFRDHPLAGEMMLTPIGYLREALIIPAFHEERWDGSGYPHGLSGANIPIEARMFVTADTYVALTEEAEQEPTLNPDQIRQQIQSMADHELDPRTITTLFTVLDQQGW